MVVYLDRKRPPHTERLQEKYPIDTVRETPAPGLFEVQSGGDIFTPTPPASSSFWMVV
ncbi:MAG: hypothetical protein IPH35_09075 [Rhodoferax sp.]|nr:hypothetical protein [Rhodoferax sp.]